MWILEKDNNWKNVNSDTRKEKILIDEPEGQVVLKTREEPKQETVLVDIPEGHVVLKKARKPRKKNDVVKAI